MLPDNVIFYGQEQPLPARRRLRAGPLTLIYEEGDLRYIRLGDREIVRRIYVAVRDPNWGTVPPLLTNIRMQIKPDSFSISYEVQHRQDEIDFYWKGSITGDAHGTLRFEMDGEARSTFLRNRIGFCVLHPSRECPGTPCWVQKPDGSIEAGAFPVSISPHQPFKDLRAIAHEVIPGIWAELRFEGDLFEMEDQRNWTDASFKTYCTPLALPYPVQVQHGERVSQSVTLTLQGDLDGLAENYEESGLTFTLGDAATPLPRIGLGLPAGAPALTPREVERLRAARLSHLRVDLHLHAPDLPQELQRAVEASRALDLPLEIALFLTDQADEELQALLAHLIRIQPRVLHWLVFHEGEKSTSERWVRLARARLSSYDPWARIGAGTNAYFTELNRGRPPVDTLQLVSYSINPQVHAFDNASLVETLEAQATTVASARQITGALPLVISPVTLRPRFNPDATGPPREPGPGELPASVDPRQMSLFGAGWTAGSIKYLAQSGVSSITYYETVGSQGVMESVTGTRVPDLFRSQPGTVYPLYHVLADVDEFAGGQVIHSSSSDSLRVDGLVLRHEGRTCALLANFTAAPLEVTVVNWPGEARMRCLDRSTFEHATNSPESFRSAAAETVAPTENQLTVEILPFAVVRLDVP